MLEKKEYIRRLCYVFTEGDLHQQVECEREVQIYDNGVLISRAVNGSMLSIEEADFIKCSAPIYVPPEIQEN